MSLHDSRPQRRGFTLVELLVVIAVIGILTALLIPAVQMAREAGRRINCSSNMRQFGLGFIHFHDAHGFLPPGAISNSATASAEVRKKFSIATTKTEHGWGPFLLPFIEHKNLYDQYYWDADWRAPENKSVRETALAVFTCPSVPNGQQGKRRDGRKSDGFEWKAAAGDYSVMNGLNWQGLWSLNLIDDYGRPRNHTNRRTFGAMRTNELVSFSQIGDGLSYTTWFTENAGRPAVYRMGGKLVTATGNEGAGWADRENSSFLHGFNVTTDSLNGPCPVNCTNRAEIYSFHPGGAMIVRGDGSTKCLSELTSIQIVARLITRKAKDPRFEF